ncbi:ParA family chromosome partitioning ATPase [Deinococcus proteolyticus MRP]|uniref:ParA family chromosome partitioning ATPase n=1 Tax=Deinococcus proteolyticus (strain ATCC 35074 / DSM 20540 / JCM 6276 / NBRC 101906 / NCIMB 13154 / VKM Ac-1939 / CCM 2703 / MRP) TaxID=693977 RepID=F0RM59_DEIPM|nr:MULTISPECIES: ParA family protein [Deinococcus]ADY25979.1 ParA family chromosome partitioning ATPase [Deinococcus proteolyticus MRP]MCY1702100.1 ParA family protein [Deinococcus sp. SL84]
MPRIIAITSEKGGVGKSTLAVHLAGALSERGLETVLIDEDGRVGSSLRWSQRGPGLPFAVLDPDDVKPKRLARLDAVIIDTEGRPRRRDLRELAGRADLILVPSGVSPLELDATQELMGFLGSEPGAARRSMAVLTRVPPVGHAADTAREDLRELGIRVANTAVRQYAAYQKAAEQGVLCRDVRDERAAAAWADLLALSREVI